MHFSKACQLKILCRLFIILSLFATIALIYLRNDSASTLKIHSENKLHVDDSQTQSRLKDDISAMYEFGLDLSHQNDHDVLNAVAALRKDGYDLSPVSVEICAQTDVIKKRKVKTRTLALTSEATNHSETLVAPTGSLLSAKLIVPNVVHYVFIGTDLTFTFINYLSFLSVERFLQPEQIFVYGDVVPTGHWWNLTIKQVRNIYHVKWPYSVRSPSGEQYIFSAHISDYIRAQLLIRYGGIYLDADVFVLKSFDALRKYTMVLGRETKDGICNGIIIAKRNAPFLRLMLEQYRSYAGLKESWAGKSVLNTHTLAQLYPHLIHVEETSLNQPNWCNASLIYDGNYDWRNNYAMHLWVRLWPAEERPQGPRDVLGKYSTLGQMSRLILFGIYENSSAINYFVFAQLGGGLKLFFIMFYLLLIVIIREIAP